MYWLSRSAFKWSSCRLAYSAFCRRTPIPDAVLIRTGPYSVVTVSSFPVPEDGKKISSDLTVSTGSVRSVEWSLTDDKPVALTADDVFRAGHKYSASIYLVPPTGSEWQPMTISNTIIYDMPDVDVKVRDTAGNSLRKLSGSWMSYIFVTKWHTAFTSYGHC